MEPTSLHFASAARAIGDAARRGGWAVPAFRSPPRLTGADRTIRRRPRGEPTVSVRYRQRPWNAVLADLIEGVVVANRLGGVQADGCRTRLWAALEDRPEIGVETRAAPAPRALPTPAGTGHQEARVHHLAA